MPRRADSHEHHQAQVQPLAIQQRDPALDHAFGLQPLHAFPAWGLGEAGAFGQLGDRQGGVGLQLPQDASIGGVENFFHASP